MGITEEELSFDNKLRELSNGVYLKKDKNYNNENTKDSNENTQDNNEKDSLNKKSIFNAYLTKENITSKEKTDEKWGFSAEVFEVDGKIVIAYRGTDDTKDRIADLKMGFFGETKQHKQALDYYKRVVNNYCKDENGNITKEIVLTGHSLGGSLAQYVAYINDEKAVTFCAYGMKNRLKKEEYNELKMLNAENNIKNYGNNRDPIFMSNVKNHIGQTLVIKDEHKFYKDGIESRHSLKNIGDLKDAKPYNPQVHKLIGKYPNKNPNRIIVMEDLMENIIKKESHFDDYDFMYLSQQNHRGNVMWKREADSKVSSGEVYVSAYTRGDGTHVTDYYRSYPHC